MMMQKHQGGLTTVCLQIDLQPRELGSVKVPSGLAWLMCVKRDKVITLVAQFIRVCRWLKSVYAEKGYASRRPPSFHEIGSKNSEEMHCTSTSVDALQTAIN